MAAEKGNQHWLKRLDLSEDGKKLSIEEVKTKAKEYIELCIDNPILEIDYKGKDADKVYLEKPRPMTTEGLCVYMGIGVTTWKDWRKDEKYSPIVTRINNIMFAYNFEQAGVNRMNASLIAKKLGISEKTDIKIFKEQPFFPDAHNEEEQ